MDYRGKVLAEIKVLRDQLIPILKDFEIKTGFRVKNISTSAYASDLPLLDIRVNGDF